MFFVSMNIFWKTYMVMKISFGRKVSALSFQIHYWIALGLYSDFLKTSVFNFTYRKWEVKNFS